MRGVFLYGPPASGKDTISHEIVISDRRFTHFQLLKVGEGRTNGYRLTTQSNLARLQALGEIAWLTHRYQATYAVDTPALLASLANHIVIIHVGQPQAIEAIRRVTAPTDWAVVELWYPREIAAQRLVERGSRDVADRLAIWDATPSLHQADLRIDTSETHPADAARQVRAVSHANRKL